MGHDLEEEGVGARSPEVQGMQRQPWKEGHLQNSLWAGAQEASIWGTFHVTWSSKAQRSNLGQGERLGQALPAPRQPPGEGGRPRGASPHLRVVPLIKPEAPRLRTGWDPGSEEAGTQTSGEAVALACPRVQTALPSVPGGDDPGPTVSPSPGLQEPQLLGTGSLAQRSCSFSHGPHIHRFHAVASKVTEVLRPSR